MYAIFFKEKITIVQSVQDLDIRVKLEVNTTVEEVEKLNIIKNIIDDEKDRLEKEKLKIEYEKFIKNVYTTFKTEINDKDGIGSISELYDAQAPYKPGGTFAQAWSISEVLKIVTKLK